MLKNTLIKCAQLLDRDDLIEELSSKNSIAQIDNLQVKSDVLKLINYYNYITNLIINDYLNLSSFLFVPTEIINVSRGNIVDKFNFVNEYLLVDKPNTKYDIEYKFKNDELKDLKDCNCFKLPIDENILSFGIVSYYLSAKSKYNESEFYYDKFMYEMFKLKTKKGRRIKPNFRI